MPEPGKVVKPRTKSAQFSLGSILTANGNVIPFFNTVDYLEENDLVLYDVIFGNCKITLDDNKIAFPISIAVLPKFYPITTNIKDDVDWKNDADKKIFCYLWYKTWSSFMKKYDCGLINLEIDEKDFINLWQNNDLYKKCKQRKRPLKK